MMHIAKSMIQKRPWFGYGTGGISTALPHVVPVKQRQLNPWLNYVESIYLNYWLEYGLVGLLIFLIFIGIQIRVSFQLPKEYRFLIQVVMIAFFFGGFFNSFVMSAPIAHMYSLLAAACFSALPRLKKSSTGSQPITQ